MYRESLIKDLEYFIEESVPLYNKEKIVKKSVYDSLVERIDSLKSADFESSVKYRYFLSKYIDNIPKQKEKMAISNSFKDNYLELEPFNKMINHFIFVASWLK